ncbi:MAG: restriction endonuclease subunit S [Oscillospiraceae bacterium]|nr:restriction endonuclease subunit S [Oscillospiraceae bacterium]
MTFETHFISELIDEISMGPFGSNIKVECFVDDGVPVLNGSNLEGYELKEDSFRYVTEEKADSLNKANAYRGDVVITHRGTLGQIVFIPQASKYERYVISQSQFRIRCNDKILPEYMVYYFHTRIGQHKLLSNASQVGVPALARPSTTFQKIDIEIPDIETQKRIVAVLQRIHDKIAINTAINENLEQQIQTILLNLIKADSENDSIETVKLGDYLYIKGRIGWKGLKKDEYLESSDYRIINGESLTKDGIDWGKAGYISAERYDESPEIMLQIGDILLSKDGTIGKIGYVDRLDSPSTVASGIFVIRNIKPDIISTQFIYYLLKSKLFTAFIASRTEGSVIPHLYQKDFMEFMIPLPNAEEMSQFDSLTSPLFATIVKNLRENEHLAATRDALLPKLMKGEIDVSSVRI